MFTRAPICYGCLESQNKTCLGVSDRKVVDCPEFFSITLYKCELRDECPQARGSDPCIYSFGNPGPLIPGMCEYASIRRGEPTVVNSVPTIH